LIASLQKESELSVLQYVVGFIGYRQCSLQATLEKQKKELIASLQKESELSF
jgi:hypothetical protein